MSWFNRSAGVRRALTASSLACALALQSGCGFTPLYGVNSASHKPATIAQFAAIELPVLPDRLGQRMRNLLIDSLHPGGAATEYRYRLTMIIKEAVINIGLQENSTSTRGQVRLTVVYYLTDEETGKTMLTETLRTSTGYNILINQFSSILSQEDAETQGLKQIADSLTEHLALYFHKNA